MDDFFVGIKFENFGLEKYISNPKEEKYLALRRDLSSSILSCNISSVTNDGFST